jgi:hypothetical protein
MQSQWYVYRNEEGQFLAKQIHGYFENIDHYADWIFGVRKWYKCKKAKTEQEAFIEAAEFIAKNKAATEQEAQSAAQRKAEMDALGLYALD